MYAYISINETICININELKQVTKTSINELIYCAHIIHTTPELSFIIVLTCKKNKILTQNRNYCSEHY